jgi:16S rRNA (guanine527-N7)-methyltransferase
MSTIDASFAALSSGVEVMGIALPGGANERLLGYLDLLERWNRTYNLTAIRDRQAMLKQHLLDSLAVLPLIEKSALAARHGQLRIADVGSGAGLPGIPLALARPEWQVTTIETVEKKSAFQQQAKIELAVANLTVINARVEQFASAQFDCVISRAFASLADYVGSAGHLIESDGFLCAMKGVLPVDEMATLPAGWRVDVIESLAVPGLDARRHALLLRKT